jgi:hypothetical protein
MTNEQREAQLRRSLNVWGEPDKAFLIYLLDAARAERDAARERCQCGCTMVADKALGEAPAPAPDGL